MLSKLEINAQFQQKYFPIAFVAPLRGHELLFLVFQVSCESKVFQKAVRQIISVIWDPTFELHEHGILKDCSYKELDLPLMQGGVI